MMIAASIRLASFQRWSVNPDLNFIILKIIVVVVVVAVLAASTRRYRSISTEVVAKSVLVRPGRR